MSVVIHPAATLHSRRHWVMWFLFCHAAGAVNAGALLACNRFVTHITGTSTRIGVDMGEWRLVADYSIVLLCFILGAACSVFFLHGRDIKEKQPMHAIPLVIASLLLVGVAAAGHGGVFGEFGEAVESTGDFLLLSLLSTAMGIQNATVAASSSMVVRTTHMTGPASDIGVLLGTALHSQGRARLDALRGVALRVWNLTGFILGCAAMAALSEEAEYLAFLFPSALILAGAGLGFRPARFVTDDAPPRDTMLSSARDESGRSLDGRVLRAQA